MNAITKEIRIAERAIAALEEDYVDTLAEDYGSTPEDEADKAADLRFITERIEYYQRRLETYRDPEYAAAHERRLWADSLLGH